VYYFDLIAFVDLYASLVTLAHALISFSGPTWQETLEKLISFRIFSITVISMVVEHLIVFRALVRRKKHIRLTRHIATCAAMVETNLREAFPSTTTDNFTNTLPFTQGDDNTVT
jgi:hypothetical protein